ncbi:MAG: sensor histidine kinase, partial [Hyphomicrobium sp.]
MERVLDYLFNGATFMPHGTCLLWRPDLVAAHALGDGLIALAYFSIPIALVIFIRRRADLEYRWLFSLFAAFILACGATHLIGVVTLWEPIYGIQAVVKLATALISLATAIVLWPMIPKALAIPSPARLRVANMQLLEEIRERKTAQDKLERAYATIESGVDERTRELAEANQRLETEIAERKRGEEHQSLLVAELAHRVRNTLAIVRSIASQTVRHSKDLEQFEASFDGRLQALAQAHTLLITARWERTDLRTLLTHQLNVYAVHSGAFSYSGPHVTVSPKAAVTFGLVIHELAVNATKYGSLSVPDGRVDVRWRMQSEADSQNVQLLWSESGGPAVSPPRHEGFGSKLITFSIAHEFGGKADIFYASEGVQWRLTL